MQKNIIERFFSTRETLNHSLLTNTEYQLEKAIQLRGKASFLVSGGSTPVNLYQALSQVNIPWHQVQVALVDERWVDSEHAASNEKLIKQYLLQQQATNAIFYGMKNQAKSAQGGLKLTNERYQSLTLPFDVTLLGMGADGHTASLFANSIISTVGLNPAERTVAQLCCAVHAQQSEITGEFTERMSLTLAALKRSRMIKLLITGKEKLAVYRNALLNPNSEELPISAILHQSIAPVIVYWAP